MNTLKLEFNNTTIDVDVPLNMTIESVLFTLKVQEELPGNTEYVLFDQNDNEIDNRTLVRSLKSSIHRIEEKQAEKENYSKEAIKRFHQLGLFLLDGSSSMESITEGGISKAETINTIMKDLISGMKDSRCAVSFSFGIITFDHNSLVKLTNTPILSIDENLNYNPLENHGGKTNFYKAFELAKQQIESHFLNEKDVSEDKVTIRLVLMSDGEDHFMNETITLVDSIKSAYRSKDIEFYTCFFSSDDNNVSAQNHLKKIASNSNNFISSIDAQEIRMFFESSVTAGVNA